jgi:type II secretory pathway pseudopilin PulG
VAVPRVARAAFSEGGTEIASLTSGKIFDMLNRRIKGNKGFTLVEAVISVMIMGMSLGACILTFSLAARIVATGENQLGALHASRAELERLRMYKFTNSVLSAGSYNFTNLFGSGTYSVTNMNSNAKTIIVNVPYLNPLRTGYLTNTLTTEIVTTLHE